MARNYFQIAGHDSREFGVYISGAGTYNSPAKASEYISIPGRNGDLISGQDRFENVELTYHAFIYRDFDANLAALRAFLLSLDGYQRLEDSYHPDEFRMASYQGALTVTATPRNDAGEFDITFNCKPQRFLLSGENEVTVSASDAKETDYSGSQFSFDADSADSVSAFSIDLAPTISSGTPSPTTPITIGGISTLRFHQTGQNLVNMGNQYTKQGSNNATSSGFNFYVPIYEGQYTFSCRLTENDLTGTGNRFYFEDLINGGELAHVEIPAGYTGIVHGTFTIPEGGAISAVRVRTAAGNAGHHVTFSQIQFELGDVYHPYQSGIAPVAINLRQTVYKGSLNVLTGALTLTALVADLGDFTWSSGTAGAGFMSADDLMPTIEKPAGNNTPLDGLVCDHLPTTSANGVYNQGDIAAVGVQSNGRVRARFPGYSTDPATFKTSVTGWKLLYPLATPQTITLSPQTLTLLEGQNTLRTVRDCTVNLTIAEPAKIVNPTPFNARPLITTRATGTLVIDDVTVTIAQAYVNIDCEMQDCYYGATNLNDKVTFSNHEFPVLKPGANAVSFGGNLTSLTVVPRWWTV